MAQKDSHEQKSWWYDDLEGVRRGPFSDAVMDTWAKNNMLPPDVVAFNSCESTSGIKIGILGLARGDQWALKGPPRPEDVERLGSGDQTGERDGLMGIQVFHQLSKLLMTSKRLA